MKKRCKQIVYLVAILLIVISATAYASVPEDVLGTQYEEAARSLGNLKIMVGDAAGFRPNDSIKRAEFAAILIRTIGMEGTLDSIDSNASFSDVAPSHWSYKYVELASRLGIINGMGDGTFHPDGEITFAQAVKMLVSALGYTPAANEKGGYPNGYLLIAADEDILEGVSKGADETVNRGEVAILTENSLVVPMMVKNGSVNKEKYVKSGTAGTKKQTFLITKLKIDEVKALITKSEIKESTIEAKISLTDEADYTQLKSYKAHNDVNFIGFEHSEVTLWVNSDHVVINILKEKTDNVVYDFIAQVNGDKSPTSVYVPSAIYSIKMKNSGIAYNVGQDTSSPTIISYNNNLADETPVSFVNCFIKAIVDGRNIKRMEVYPMKEGGLISQVGRSITFIKGNLNGQSIDSVLDAEEVLVYMNMRVAKFTDLEPDMLFDYWRNFDGSKFVIVASNEYMQGNLNAVSSDKIIVEKKSSELDDTFTPYYSLDGLNYEISNQSEMMLGKPVCAYRDAKGQVRYIRYNGNETLSSFYGVVTKAWTEDADYLKIFQFTGKGVENTFKVNLKNSEVNLDIAKSNQSNYDGKGVYKFTLNNSGEIEKIQTIDFNSRTVASQSSFFNESPGRLLLTNGQSVLLSGTTIVALTSEDGKFTPKILLWDTDLKDRKCATSMKMQVDLDPNHMQPNLMLITTDWKSIHKDEVRYGFVTEMSKVSSNEYELNIRRRGIDEKYTIDLKNLQSGLTVAKDYFVLFYTGVIYGKNGIDFIAAYDLSESPDTWSMNEKGTIYAVQDGYITLQNVDGSIGSTMVMNSVDSQVFEVNSEGEFSNRSFGDLHQGQKVWCIYYQNQVRAVFYMEN